MMFKPTIKKIPLVKNLIQLVKGKSQASHISDESVNSSDSQNNWIKTQAQAFLNTGNRLIQEDKFEQALICYQEAISLDPEYADAYFFKGVALAGLKQLDEAIASYQIALKFRPNWAQAYLDLGNLFSQKEERQTALKYYDKAIALKPDWGAAYFYRGNIRQSQEQYEEAIFDYQKASEIGLEWDELYKNLTNSLAIGAAKLSNKKLTQILTNFQDKLKRHPDNHLFHLGLGHLYKAQGKEKLATQSYQKALSSSTINLKDNDTDSIGNQLCLMYRQMGIGAESQEKWEEAAHHYKLAIELNQEDKDLSRQLWLMYRQMGMMSESQEKWEEAASHYKSAIEFNREDEGLSDQLAKIYQKLEQWDEAIETYKTAIINHPNSANLTMSLASLFLQLNKTQEAISYYQQTITLKPDWIDAYTQAGIAIFLGGQMEEAVIPWRKGLAVQRELAQKHNLDQLGLRFVGNSWLLAIGHIATFDTYIKTGMLGWRSPQETWLVVRPNIKIPNPTFVNYWKPYINIEFDEAKSPIDPKLAAYVTDEFWCADLPDGKTHIYYRWASEVQRQWEIEQRPPLLQISPEDHQRGWDNLEKLGMPRDAWFVCLHVRESGFHKNWNQKYAATRDAKIDTYNLAIETIIAQGGWVIRVGDPSMKPLPQMKQVIDYAHSELKSDWMDVFLCGECRFYMGTNSGLFLVPPVFGVPCILTNWNPMAVRPHYGQDIVIPKLYWSEAENRYLSFGEMIAPPVGYSQFTRDFEALGLQVIDNTPEDLQAAVLEMLGRLSGTLQYSEVDKALQQRFDQVALKAGSYGGTPIGQQFLNKYSHLL